MRKPDGWHFCPTGAERVADDLNAAVAARGWMPVATAGWEAGDWRQAALYDDPVGGCTVK